MNNDNDADEVTVKISNSDPNSDRKKVCNALFGEQSLFNVFPRVSNFKKICI